MDSQDQGKSGETVRCKILEGSHYLKQLANVVSMPKMNGKVRICVDFRDLNKANPKDDFSLPHIDILVNNTVGHALISFMDGFSRYNQIKMAPKNMENTSFYYTMEDVLLQGHAI